jgi:hypothetical protein
MVNSFAPCADLAKSVPLVKMGAGHSAHYGRFLTKKRSGWAFGRYDLLFVPAKQMAPG